MNVYIIASLCLDSMAISMNYICAKNVNLAKRHVVNHLTHRYLVAYNGMIGDEPCTDVRPYHWETFIDKHFVCVSVVTD